MRRTLVPIAVAVLAFAGAPRAAEHTHGAPPAATPPLFTDLGSHHHPIATQNAEAQRYFDQGLRLVYAFNHAEAIRAFREAARLDPDCAMAQWGIALAFGPNYNMPLDAEGERHARAALARAQELAPKAPAAEQAYISAVAIRYGDGERPKLDRAYADAMRELSRRHPDDLDAATLYAEALMVLRPWALWNPDGTPAPDTLEIVTTLERVLAKDPSHPGANHYYVHAIEASPTPERGLASAKRLPGLMPGAGHLVHMPSHIYMRVGRYADAAAANQQAIVVDKAYLAREKPSGVYPMMYYPHNIHFLWAAASMQGRSAVALEAAREVTAQIEPAMLREMPPLEYFAPTLLFAQVRFGKWEDVLATPAPPAEFVVWTGMWHFARGMALAAKGRGKDADAEREALAKIAIAVPADRIFADNQPAAQHLALAVQLLAGEIAGRQGHTDEAVALLREAVKLEDALPYTEPPPWALPSRLALGAVLLAAGRDADAEVVYREDLARYPDNGWALFGLAQSQHARDASAAEEARRKFETAWAAADVTLPASRF